MSFIENTSIRLADSASVDAFGRLIVAPPTYVFDAQLTYDLQPLLYEQVTAISGASITYDATNRMATMIFAATATGGKAYMQSYECFRYQPGRSQKVFMTFNFVETKANCLKFVGYSDGVNGIELQQNGTTVQFQLLTATTHGSETVAQASWNLDTFNGSGPSGLTLDLTKVQILVIDFQALYVGRVRVGFDINGVVYWAHQFTHANIDVYPYWQSANLPVRCGMTCTGTVTTTMNYICCSVLSNGGQDEVGGYAFTTSTSVAAGASTRAHLLSIRPKTTFNSITNRTKLVLESIELVVTGANPVLLEVAIGQAISGTTTFADVNSTYSAFEINTAGTLSGSPAIVAAAFYAPASAQTKGTISSKLTNRYPITLDHLGTVRANGVLTLLGTGLGGASALQASMNWKEIR